LKNTALGISSSAAFHKFCKNSSENSNKAVFLKIRLYNSATYCKSYEKQKLETLTPTVKPEQMTTSE